MENNLNKIKKYVSTQYNDLTGVIQLDGHMNINSIYELCEDYKFKTDDKFIVGFGLDESSILGVGSENTVYCTIIYVDKSTYGSTYDEVAETIKSTENVIFTSKNFEVNYTDLKKYIKRFDFIALTEIADLARNFKIVEQ